MLDIFIIDSDKQASAALQGLCFKYLIREDIEGEIYVCDSVSDDSTAGIYMLAFSKDMESCALKIKGSNSQSYIIVLVSSVDELMKSVRPPICPSGYLMKPFKAEETEVTLNNIYTDYKRCCCDENDEIFSFKVKAKNYSIPYGRIVFFESDRKKVIVRTEIQEFEFYSTLDNVLKAAPKDFVKVHKSYVVNVKHIISADFGTLTIKFDDGSQAYFSRTYKDELKSALEKRTVRS